MLEEAGAADACVLATDPWAEIAGVHPPRGAARGGAAQYARDTDPRPTGPRRTGRLQRPHSRRACAFWTTCSRRSLHHGGVSLAVEAARRPDIDEHHTMEDVGHHAGRSYRPALGAKADCPLWLRAADGRPPGAGAARLGGRIDFEGRRNSAANGWATSPRSLFRHFFQLCCAARCKPADRGPGRERPPQGRSDLQGLRPALRMAVQRQGFGYDIPQQQRSPYDSRCRLRYGQPAIGCRCAPAGGRVLHSRPMRRYCCGADK